MPPELFNRRMNQNKIDLAEALEYSADLRIVTAEFVKDFNKLKDAAIEKLNNVRAAPKKVENQMQNGAAQLKKASYTPSIIGSELDANLLVKVRLFYVITSYRRRERSSELSSTMPTKQT